MFSRKLYRFGCSVLRLRNVKSYKETFRTHKPLLIKLATTPIAMLAVVSMASEEVEKKPVSKIQIRIPIKDAITRADNLFSDGHFSDLIEFLRLYADVDDPEIQWRLARALYNYGKHNSNEVDKPKLTEEAYTILEAALKKWDEHYAIHKWYAILLDEYAALSGIKSRISQMENVKTHLMRTVELNPKDATTWYMLGEFSYQVADLPWYQRQIASALFGSPPAATFEEALHYFTKAEETEPLFYSLNLLMLGKTYHKLGKTEKAVFYLEKAQRHPKTNDDDMLAHNEAVKLLHKIKK